jgi:hypothetical protein
LGEAHCQGFLPSVETANKISYYFSLILGGYQPGMTEKARMGILKRVEHFIFSNAHGFFMLYKRICIKYSFFKKNQKEKRASLPTVFLLSSQGVLIKFSMCSPSSQYVPQHVLHSTSLLSHTLWQMLSSFPPT